MTTKAIYHGGMMRCCIESLVQRDDLDTDADGTVHRCQYCQNPLILRPDGWHWHRDQARGDETNATKRFGR